MKLGVVSSALAEHGFLRGLDLARALGCHYIEIACAGFQKDLCFGDPELLVHDGAERERWQAKIADHQLAISALALHGQPLAPDPEVAGAYDRQFRAACQLASAIGVHRLTLLAGLPEGAPGDTAPCWIANAFPPGNEAILEWQWEHRVVPYWREHADYADSHGCVLCFEMHPGDVIYNPCALERLRDSVGNVIACNFDPSHLTWQGIDPMGVISRLGSIIKHVHAKDVALRREHVRRDGLFSASPMHAVQSRPWNFRTVGYGHGEEYWRELVSSLIEIGYNDVISIEHEDLYLDNSVGLRQAASLLRAILL